MREIFTELLLLVTPTKIKFMESVKKTLSEYDVTKMTECDLVIDDAEVAGNYVG